MFNFKDDIFGHGEDYIDPYLCHSFVATAVIGAGVLGAGATIFGATKAAAAQTDAAKTAANTSLGMYNTTRGDLAPFRAIGTTAGDQLTAKLSDLTTPITMDETTLQDTPGYQFDLKQGLKAVTNSAAAKGLGSSGAALKGAATFATGLADSTYQQQFANANTNQTNAYNRLKGLVDTGENASAQTGVAGTAAANTAAGAQIGAGNAQAASYNAIGTGVNNLGNNVAGAAIYKGIYGTPSGVNANGSIAGAVGPTSVGGAPLVY